MKKALKFMVKILKDERGIAPLIAGAAIMGGSNILGSAFGNKKQKVYDPYESLRNKYKSYLENKIGTSTPYSYNDAFTIAQPDIEKQAESSISEYLKNPTSNVSDYTEATKKYSDAFKESSAKTYDEEMNKTKDMYNRLGLVSSTPGLTAQGDVAENQRISQNLFDSELLYKNLDRTLQAQGMDVSQLSDMLNKATALGQTQRDSQQYSQKMSMADIERMLSEEMGYAELSGSLLGSNPPQVTYEPNWALNLAQTGQDIGSLIAMSSVLGGGSSGSTGLINGGTNLTNADKAYLASLGIRV